MNTTIIIVTTIIAATILIFKFMELYSEFKKDSTINKYYNTCKDIKCIKNIVVKNIEQNNKYNNTENEERYMYGWTNEDMRKILDQINIICEKWD